MLPHRPSGQAQEVRHLQHGNDHRDACGKAQHHRIGNKLYQPPHTGYAQRHQQHTGHHGGDQQAAKPVLLNDGKQDDNKRCRRSGNVKAGAPGQGDNCTRNNGRIEPMLRWHTRRDGQRHGQGHGHCTHGHSRHDVLPQFRRSVTVPKRIAKPGGDAGNTDPKPLSRHDRKPL